MKFFLLICLFVLSSCGESPLFNHQTEKEGPSKNPRALEADIYSFQKTDFCFFLLRLQYECLQSHDFAGPVAADFWIFSEPGHR